MKTTMKMKSKKTKRKMSTKRRWIAAAKAGVFALALVSLLSSAFAGEDPKKHYALIFGTVYGNDDRPLYGVRITIHPVGRKHPNWDLISDHRGEFAQRVPPGPEDYEIKGEAVMAPVEDGKPQPAKKKTFNAATKIHVEAEERKDVSLHLND